MRWIKWEEWCAELAGIDSRCEKTVLDEGLQAITLLWSGDPVTFHGRYVTEDDVLTRPHQRSIRGCPSGVGGE